jgi:Ecdysteroid kinase-like family
MGDLTVTESEIPEWLTADFFRDVLTTSGHIAIKHVQFACAKGDNFCSKIFRVVLDIDHGSSISLIVKSRPLEEGFSTDFSKKFDVFTKEIEMYNNVKRFEEIFRKHGHDVIFSPK